MQWKHPQGALNAYVFTTLIEVREKAEEWRVNYNCSRPHQSLGFVPPAEYKTQLPTLKPKWKILLLSVAKIRGAYVESIAEVVGLAVQ